MPALCNILIIYTSRQYPMRASQRDHLWSFERYAQGCRCFYVNVAFQSLPPFLSSVEFDLIIFDWLFLGTRVDRDWFRERVRALEPLKRSGAVKIVLPQDEFVSMDLLCDLINDFGVRYVFSVAPESEWPKLYRTVDRSRVKFLRVLTGYLDEELVRKVAALSIGRAERRIDIGYRTVSSAVWGRFNLIKGELATLFQQAVSAHGLTADIAVGARHFLMGDAWLEFLLGCKYTLGVEGGSSLLDWDGSLLPRIERYVQQHPNASFDELESACIPKGRDGEINVVAISPRHLEACLTRTCQILVEGEYNGILRPQLHYLELKRNFSNLEEVLSAVKRDSLRQSIVERAYRDVVASGECTYAGFVHFVLSHALPEARAVRTATPLRELRNRLVHAWVQLIDRATWSFVFLYSIARTIRNRLGQRA
jgi:hypothetical protein